MGEKKRRRAQMTDYERLMTDLGRKLADDGKLIEAGWIGLRKVWVAEDASAEQVADMRKAFMAGAQHLFAGIMNILDDDREPTAADLRRPHPPRAGRIWQDAGVRSSGEGAWLMADHGDLDTLGRPKPTWDRKGPNNPNWRGGRTVDPRGYVLVRVGVGHPLADVRGYAYEHRLVAQDALGRNLAPGEEVHHETEVKNLNSPHQLKVAASKAEHRSWHRLRTDLRPFGGDNPLVSCACGCGQSLLKYDTSNRPRRFLSGHNLRAPNHG